MILSIVFSQSLMTLLSLYFFHFAFLTYSFLAKIKSILPVWSSFNFAEKAFPALFFILFTAVCFPANNACTSIAVTDEFKQKVENGMKTHRNSK